MLHGSSPETVQLPAWNAPGSLLNAADTQRVLGSPYRRVYELARGLAGGKPTEYDVVRNTQNYLENHYSYSEQPPVRKYPLAAFLFKDKIGYCQQFAGSMALMLRMDGIPARVAGGFAPGLYDGTTKEYRVRDLDAHSWVEVWFHGIGWVPFDPTPSVAPASAQAAAPTLPSAANGDSQDKGSTPLKSNTGGPPPAQPAAQPSSTGGTGRLWMVLGIVAAILAAGVLAGWLFGSIRARRLRGRHEEHILAELTAALVALGHPVAPGDTLTRIERSVSDERVRRYIRLLREARFSREEPAAPGPRDRRALRSGLMAGRGSLAHLRGYLALPPSRRRFRAS